MTNGMLTSSHASLNSVGICAYLPSVRYVDVIVGKWRVYSILEDSRLGRLCMKFDRSPIHVSIAMRNIFRDVWIRTRPRTALSSDLPTLSDTRSEM